MIVLYLSKENNSLNYVIGIFSVTDDYLLLIAHYPMPIYEIIKCEEFFKKRR